MEGTGKWLCEGLELFSRRNKDSTKHVILRVRDELDPTRQERLGNAIRRSSKHVKTIAMIHQGDLEKSLVKVAGQCHSLSVLSSTTWGHEEQIFVPDAYAEDAEFSSSWRVSLITLDWRFRRDEARLQQ